MSGSESSVKPVPTGKRDEPSSEGRSQPAQNSTESRMFSGSDHEIYIQLQLFQPSLYSTTPSFPLRHWSTLLGVIFQVML